MVVAAAAAEEEEEDDDDVDIEEFVARMIVQPPPPFSDADHVTDLRSVNDISDDVVATSAGHVTASDRNVNGEVGGWWGRAACIDKTCCTAATTYSNWPTTRRPSDVPPPPPLGRRLHALSHVDADPAADLRLPATSHDAPRQSWRWYDRVDDGLSRLAAVSATPGLRPTSLQHE